MKNAKGAGTIRHKTVIRNGKEYSYWEGRVTTGHDPLTGKQIQKSVTGSTQAEVRKKLNSIQKEVDDSSYAEPSKLTVSQWLDIWIEDFSSNVKISTKELRKKIIDLYLKPGIGSVKLTSLNTLQIQKMYNSIRGKNKKELSAQYMRNIYSVLHSALNTAVTSGLIKHNPAENVMLRKNSESSAGNVLEDNDIAAFLDAIENHKFEKMLKTMLFTGLRRGEICGLSWDEIDFAKGEITISHQLQMDQYFKGKYVIVNTKNSKYRKIKPAKTVMDILHERKLEQFKAMLAAGDHWNNKYNLVFTVDDGKNPGRYILPTTLYNQLKRVVKSIGMPDARLHDLRHTYAVVSLRSGDDIKTVQENLGHSSAAFTLKQYIHVTDDMRDDSSVRMEEYISNIKEA